MDSKSMQPSSLIHGCEIISRKLRRSTIINGYLYRFETATNRPQPLHIFVVLLTCLPPAILLLADTIAYFLLTRVVGQDSTVNQMLKESVFINRLLRVFGFYRFAASIACSIILLATHNSMSSTFAASNQFVSEREQATFAKRTYHFYIFKGMASTVAYLSAFVVHYFNSPGVNIQWDCIAALELGLLFLLSMIHNMPLMYTCYLGSSLGRHVENFSTIHIDTMFDQFMNAIEVEDNGGRSPEQMRSLPFFNGVQSRNADEGEANESQQERTHFCCLGSCCSGCYNYLRAVGRFIVKIILATCNLMLTLKTRLLMRKYPELPEMKMTKLSSTTNIQISETMRATNCHMIRVRLRRTQIMLSELRDLVSDINRTSSPIVLIYLVYETILIIFVTTASIQRKVYKSFGISILPTISITIGLVANVVYMCTCMDETTKQLKLLINKLFDFIIMNHRVRTTGKRAAKTGGQIQSTDSEICLISGGEDGAINETWSQFQYTRKLANTIQFTMGGILPVTRRLVLSILGHILSAVFISIEIMSIIDTLNTPHEGANHTKPPTNASVTQSDAMDFYQVPVRGSSSC